MTHCKHHDVMTSTVWRHWDLWHHRSYDHS